MSIIKSLYIVAIVSGLTACGSAPQKDASRLSSPVVVSGLDDPDLQFEEASFESSSRGGLYTSSRLTGDYANYPAAHKFIDKMVHEHGFKRSYLNGLFSRVERKNDVLGLFTRTGPVSGGPPSKGSWTRYRNIFMVEKRIREGAEFMQTHRSALDRASRQYGVPPEYITAIIGVETYFGGNVGSTPVLDALATVAFDYPRRSAYFTGELEHYLLMTREEGFKPEQLVGSYAGAMGLGQFMPSSFRRYAVDFDHNGKRDLWNKVDAIGSVANYFKSHGWRAGAAVAVPATFNSNSYQSMKTGFKSRHSLSRLTRAGIKPVGSVSGDRVSLLRYSTYSGDELWIGMHNYHVITKYNHSTKYGMAVHQLAQAIKQRAASYRYAATAVKQDDPS